MRLAYLDEAGTSAEEPISVVAAAIVNADRQWRKVTAVLDQIRRQFLPIEDQKGFVFHAKDIFHGSGYFKRNEWSFENRMRLLVSILRVSYDVEIPIAITFARGTVGAELGMSPPDAAMTRHIICYAEAMKRLEAYMRKYAEDGEICSITAEDCTQARIHLRKMHEAMRSGVFCQINHIIDGVNFTEKHQCPLLQLADAFAFTFRRGFIGKKWGRELMSSVINLQRLEDEDLHTADLGGILLLPKNAHETERLSDTSDLHFDWMLSCSPHPQKDVLSHQLRLPERSA